MRRGHVALRVLAAQRQRDDMLHDPPLAHAVDLAATELADALVVFPDLEAHPGRHVLALCCANVFAHVSLRALLISM